MQTLRAPDFADVRAAALLLQGVARRTPCVHSTALSKTTGAHVVLKLENRQKTGAFKVRGACAKLTSLSAAQRAAGVVAASAGNHAQGVAFYAAHLGIAATVVMPENTPAAKIRRTESFGARVVLEGSTFAQAMAHARTLEAGGLTMIHPFDDPHVIAGQGTVGLETIAQAGTLDAIVVPVGGGGLIAGVAIAVKHLSPRTTVIGARLESPGAPTIAEGIAVESLGSLNAAIADRLVDQMLLVDEAAIAHAMHALLETERIAAEGAGAAALAAVMRYSERFCGSRTAVIVSGGNAGTAHVF